MKICDLTMPEIRRYLKECNFTKEEKRFFELRANNIQLEQCAEMMEISISTANRMSKKIKNKIERIKV